VDGLAGVEPASNTTRPGRPCGDGDGDGDGNGDGNGNGNGNGNVNFGKAVPRADGGEGGCPDFGQAAPPRGKRLSGLREGRSTPGETAVRTSGTPFTPGGNGCPDFGKAAHPRGTIHGAATGVGSRSQS
jgi:hypothetical protein